MALDLKTLVSPSLSLGAGDGGNYVWVMHGVFSGLKNIFRLWGLDEEDVNGGEMGFVQRDRRSIIGVGDL